MKNIICFTMLILIFGLSESQNVFISSINHPNEPSIMINPKNPAFLVAGSNINNYHYSTDTGKTWTNGYLTSTYGVWGDPVIGVDTSGSFYFFHLSNPNDGNWIDRIVCQKTTDNGVTWSDGTFAGLNGTKAQDKHWVVIDRKNNNIYLTWTQFDDYGSINSNDSSIILFSKSTDAGQTWSVPVRLNKSAGDCLDDDNTVEGAVPCVGPNGEIYVVWARLNQIVFNKSTDYGQTWLNEETVIDTMPGGWVFDISGVNRCNGLPIIVCDTSNGVNRGAIYVNWSDQRNGTNNTDVWLSKSVDNGNSWSAPVKVNDDESVSQQFFTWMTIDPITGYLYFIFYDRRNYIDDKTDVYIAISKDGGQTFINKCISESPFLPVSDIFLGDYTNIVAYNGIVRPIWTRLNNGQLSLWTDISNFDTLVSKNHDFVNKNNFEFENFPNPSNEYIYISYKLHKQSVVSLKIVDINGNIVKTIIENNTRECGKYIEKIDIGQLKISTGVYFLTLKIDNEIKTTKQIIIK